MVTWKYDRWFLAGPSFIFKHNSCSELDVLYNVEKEDILRNVNVFLSIHTGKMGVEITFTEYLLINFTIN